MQSQLGPGARAACPTEGWEWTTASDPEWDWIGTSVASTRVARSRVHAVSTRRHPLASCPAAPTRGRWASRASRAQCVFICAVLLAAAGARAAPILDGSLIDRGPPPAEREGPATAAWESHRRAGHLALKQGDPGAATRHYEAALRVARALDDAGWRVAASLYNLGEAYRTQGAHREAEVAFAEALPLMERAFGEEHVQVAATLSNLAGIYASTGRLDEGEPLYRRALSILEDRVQPDSLGIGLLAHNLGVIYQDSGRYEQAERMFRRSVRVLEHSLGPRHPRVARALDSHAEVLLTLGRTTDASRLRERASRIRSEAQPGR